MRTHFVNGVEVLHVADIDIDSANIVERTARLFNGRARLDDSLNNNQSTEIHCFATDSVEKFERLGSRFLGRPVGKVQLVDLGG